MGKYLAGAGINGIYADANPALRAVNELHAYLDRCQRQPSSGLRSVELREQDNRAAAGTSAAGRARSRVRTRCAMAATRSAWMRRARRSVWRPPSADAGKQGIPADVQAYCAQYGDTLIEGSGKRRSEWQFGLGIQHEILPRLSAEVTFNRRKYIEPDRHRSARRRLRPLQRRHRTCRPVWTASRITRARSTTSSRSWRRRIQACPVAAATRFEGLPTRRPRSRPAARRR